MSKNTEISKLLQGVTLTGPVLGATGTAAAPTYSFSGDPDTGVYSPAPNYVSLSAGGSYRVQVSTTDATVSVPIYGASGTVAAPGYSFIGDPNTGIYSTAADTVFVAAGGVNSASFSSTGVTVAGAINVSSGTAASPTYHFNGHTDLGFFYAGGDAVGIGCNGLKVAEFLPTGMFSNGYAGYTVSYSPTTAQTINFSLYRNAHVTLGGSPCVFTFTAPAAGSMVLIKLIQDATGSRLVTWPATVDWPGGTAPVLSTAANAVDIVSFYYDGTTYYGAVSLAFA